MSHLIMSLIPDPNNPVRQDGMYYCILDGSAYILS